VQSIPFGLLLESDIAHVDQDNQWRDDERLLERMSEEAAAVSAQQSQCYEMHVAADKVRLLIGVKGATINEISQKSRCRLNVDSESQIDSGMAVVSIQALRAGVPMSGAKLSAGEGEEELGEGDVELAIQLISNSIDSRVRALKEGLLPGAVLHVRVEKIVDFGAFVALMSGKEAGLVHISELDYEHVSSVSDYLSIGDELYVVVLSVDERGRARLSLKDVDQHTGVFEGLIDVQTTSTLRAGSSAPNATLPVRLDDHSLFPSLHSPALDSAQLSQVPAPTATASTGKTHVETLEEVTKQEWKARIRLQRERAAQEATVGYVAQAPAVQLQCDSERRGHAARQPDVGMEAKPVPAIPLHSNTSAPPRHQQEQPQQQQQDSDGLARGGGSTHRSHVQGSHARMMPMADRDYSRDIPLRPPPSAERSAVARGEGGGVRSATSARPSVSCLCVCVCVCANVFVYACTYMMYIYVCVYDYVYMCMICVCV